MNCKVLVVLIFSASTLFSNGWSQSAGQVSCKSLRVLVSIEPYRFFVETIGGERVEVETLLPAGVDPHHFAITGKQARFIAESDLYFFTALPFEQQVQRKLVESSHAQMTDLTSGFLEHSESGETWAHDGHSSGGESLDAEDTRKNERSHHHEHDSHSEHGDPHLWTDPGIVGKQVARIAEELSENLPEYREEFQDRAHQLQNRLSLLDRRFRQAIETVQCRKLMVYHPAWFHFCEAYGLQQVAVEQEGKGLSAKTLAALFKSVDASYFPALIVQPQIQSKFADQLATDIGWSVVILDPLAYDYFETMQYLETVLTKGAKK